MMHLLLRASKDDYASGRAAAGGRARHLDAADLHADRDPGVQRLELSVGDGTLGFEPAEMAEIFAALTGTALT